MPAGREELLTALEGLEGRYRHPRRLREQISDYEALRIYIVRRSGRWRTGWSDAGPSLGVTDPDELEERARPRLLREPAAVRPAHRPLVRDGPPRPTGWPRPDPRRRSRPWSGPSRPRPCPKGRKSLIFVSEGFVYDTEIDEIKRVGEAARRANVAIYFVDARGLKGLPALFSAETPVDRGHAELLHRPAGRRAQHLPDGPGGRRLRDRRLRERGLQHQEHQRPRPPASSGSETSRATTTSSATPPPTRHGTASSGRSRWRSGGRG